MWSTLSPPQRERAAPRRAVAANAKKVVVEGSSDEDEDSEAISEVRSELAVGRARLGMTLEPLLRNAPGQA